ncbi:holin [Cohnella kolymensis]|uniref:Holin n=1 Tax=Cohnella kolymensis TaxID=1590652 RepID=A0ABR5A9M8_9BACL|nr:CidA/LrgA family holin-like protein [Cohnella kolymensis]KIL37597.1 holin [Cohnella kolymensis]
MSTWLKSAAQVVFLIAFSWLMNLIMEICHLNIPGSIVGIVVLFVLLQTKVVKLEWIDLGAKWLLAEMLLFFIPSAVGIVQYKDLMLASGLRILVVVVVSILVVMAATGLMAENLAKAKETNAS